MFALSFLTLSFVDPHTHTHTHTHTYTQAKTSLVKEISSFAADRQTNRWMDRQIDRQTDILIYRQTY